MIRRSTKLKRPTSQELMIERRNRLKKMLNLNGPDVILVVAAEQYLKSFQVSWRITWDDFKLHKFPRWLLWLTDKDFRDVCRNNEPEIEFEKELTEILLDSKQNQSN